MPDAANVTYSIQNDKPMQVYALDYGETGKMDEQCPTAGVVTGQLDGTPRIFVEKP